MATSNSPSTDALTENPVQGKPSAAALIDPASLMRIKSLMMRAKVVVEGFLAGFIVARFMDLASNSVSIDSIHPGTIPAISTGDSTLDPIATTSNALKMKPICAFTCWSI